MTTTTTTKRELTKDDIPVLAPCSVDLESGWTADIRVGDAVRVGQAADKHPHERMMTGGYGEPALFYDFAGAVKKARAEEWGCAFPEHSHPTKRAQAACAAEQYFELCRSYAAGEWEWIGVVVTIRDAAGEEVATSSLWGIESYTDYWREVAAELIAETREGLA